jgi:GT2 family glycosyltransferase
VARHEEPSNLQNVNGMVDISIIIPSYNTKQITSDCIQSLLKTFSDASADNKKVTYEIIVVDNASSDGSPEMLRLLPIKILFHKENVGYAKANNKGLSLATGRYVLYLNSDTVMDTIDFSELISYLDTHQKVGGLTVNVKFQNGEIDPASHRGFPTLWRSLCYFSGLEKLTGTIPLLNNMFGGYHLLSKDLKKIHEIDSPTGAFFLVKKEILDKLKGFDEDFFMYGEDLDLSFRIKELGYSIIYYPKYSIFHLKYKSGLGTANDGIRSKIRGHFYEAMKIFYKKHYEKLYPQFVNRLVYSAIDFKKRKSS